MSTHFTTGILFMMVAFHFENGNGIKCYICRSDVERNCDSQHVMQTKTMDCPTSEHKYCRKIEQQLFFKNEESPTIIRECAKEMNPRQCYRARWVRDNSQTTCECEADGCNGAHRISSGPLAIGAIALANLLR